MITHHTRRTATDREEEDLGTTRWSHDAMQGDDANYLIVTLPADAIDALLYDCGWTKCEQDGEHQYWHSPSYDIYPQRNEAVRIALIGRAARIASERPGGYSGLHFGS